MDVEQISRYATHFFYDEYCIHGLGCICFVELFKKLPDGFGGHTYKHYEMHYRNYNNYYCSCCNDPIEDCPFYRFRYGKKMQLYSNIPQKVFFSAPKREVEKRYRGWRKLLIDALLLLLKERGQKAFEQVSDEHLITWSPEMMINLSKMLYAKKPVDTIFDKSTDFAINLANVITLFSWVFQVDEAKNQVNYRYPHMQAYVSLFNQFKKIFQELKKAKKKH